MKRYSVTQTSTLRSRATAWYEKPFVITLRIRKSTLIILLLLGYIIYSHTLPSVPVIHSGADTFSAFAPVAPAGPPLPALSNPMLPLKNKVALHTQVSAGNLYPIYQCTWYVKSRRPDVPNHLGDAVVWLSRLRALGFATGSVPKPGAIGTRGNHVVYVESVHGSTITISERNYDYQGSLRTRDAPASSFTYIY